MKEYIILFIYIICSLSFQVNAQDIHFSQFYTAPILLNPANTGFINCDYRFTANQRTQWRSVTTPYVTFAASGDLRLVKGKSGKDLLGIGAVFSTDQAGDSKFTTSQMGASIAYNQNLDRFGIQYFGGGIMLSYTTATIDYSALQFQTPGDYVATSLSFPDLSAGVQWNYIPDHYSNFNFGGAVYHINQPKKTFMNDGTSRLPTKYIINAGGRFHGSGKVEYYPKLMYASQGTYQEIVFGASARVKMDMVSNSRYGVYLGTFYRWNDAAIIITRFDIDEVSIAFSYDINVSRLRKVSEMKGGPELSIIYIGCIPSFSRKEVYCPRF